MSFEWIWKSCPELRDLEPAKRKEAMRACGFTPWRHWQTWVAFLGNFLFMLVGTIAGALLDGWPQAVLLRTDDTSLTKLPVGTAVGFWLGAVIGTLPFSWVYTCQLRFHLRRFLESDDAPSGLGQNR